MKTKIRHVGIVTQDIDTQIEYYLTHLGAKVLDDHMEKVRIVKLDCGVELLQYESMSENTLRQKGISHIAFTQDKDGNYLEVVNG